MCRATYGVAFAPEHGAGMDSPNARQPVCPSWEKMLASGELQAGPGVQSPVIVTRPLVEAMYAGRLCGKCEAVKPVATPQRRARLLNSLAGALEPRTSAYEWFSNAITITCFHWGACATRPHGAVAAAPAPGATTRATATSATTPAAMRRRPMPGRVPGVRPRERRRARRRSRRRARAGRTAWP